MVYLYNVTEDEARQIALKLKEEKGAMGYAMWKEGDKWVIQLTYGRRLERYGLPTQVELLSDEQERALYKQTLLSTTGKSEFVSDAGIYGVKPHPQTTLTTRTTPQKTRRTQQPRGNIVDEDELPGWGTHPLNDPSIVALMKRSRYLEKKIREGKKKNETKPHGATFDVYNRSMWDAFKEKAGYIPLVGFFKELHKRFEQSREETIYEAASKGKTSDAAVKGAIWGVYAGALDLPGQLYDAAENFAKTNAPIGTWTGISKVNYLTQTTGGKIEIPVEEIVRKNLFYAKYMPEELKETQRRLIEEQKKLEQLEKERRKLETEIEKLDKQAAELEELRARIESGVASKAEIRRYNALIGEYNKKARDLMQRAIEYNMKAKVEQTRLEGLQKALQQQYDSWNKALARASLAFGIGALLGGSVSTYGVINNVNYLARYVAPEKVVTKVTEVPEKSPAEYTLVDFPTTPRSEATSLSLKTFNIKYNPERAFDRIITVVKPSKAEQYLVNTLKTPLDDFLDKFGKVTKRVTVKETLYKGWLKKQPIETKYITRLLDETGYTKTMVYSLDEQGRVLLPETSLSADYSWGGKNIGMNKITTLEVNPITRKYVMGSPENWEKYFFSGGRRGVYYDPVNIAVVKQIETTVPTRGQFAPLSTGAMLQVSTAPMMQQSSQLLRVIWGISMPKPKIGQISPPIEHQSPFSEQTQRSLLLHKLEMAEKKGINPSSHITPAVKMMKMESIVKEQLNQLKMSPPVELSILGVKQRHSTVVRPQQSLAQLSAQPVAQTFLMKAQPVMFPNIPIVTLPKPPTMSGSTGQTSPRPPRKMKYLWMRFVGVEPFLISLGGQKRTVKKGKPGKAIKKKQSNPNKNTKKKAQASVINHASIVTSILPRNSLIIVGLLK